jgi:glycosyltransferase involved in cell wall biosynthesis
MKLAFLGFPHLGGTFTVYCHLRAGLAARGVEVRWLAIGRAAHRELAGLHWIDELPHGTVVGSPDDRDEILCAELVRNLETERFDGVFVNVLTSRAEMNAVRYLRSDIIRVMIVHNITPGTYTAASAIKEHVHVTVAVSPRIRSDLVRNYSFSPQRTVTIYHGVDGSAAASPACGRYEAPLRLIYLGRIDDAAKGVFWLPQILDQSPPGTTLTIAGDGPDLPELRKQCGRTVRPIVFLGPVRPEQVRSLLVEHDVLIMPSRFEGFGLTLVEAMAAGCVPVATRIAGVTDEIVTDTHDGILFRPGDTRAAAQAISLLSHDLARLRSMSKAARRTVNDRFTIQTMAAQYLDLIRTIYSAPPPIAPPLELEDWRLPSAMRSGLRTYLPTSVKNLLRIWHERFVM